MHLEGVGPVGELPVEEGAQQHARHDERQNLFMFIILVCVCVWVCRRHLIGFLKGRQGERVLGID